MAPRGSFTGLFTASHVNLHVRGHKEEGTITTPFDMTVLNDLHRYHLAGDVVDRVKRLELCDTTPLPGRGAEPARGIFWDNGNGGIRNSIEAAFSPPRPTATASRRDSAELRPIVGRQDFMNLRLHDGRKAVMLPFLPP
jgi:XFP C-terminal domain